MISNLTVNNNNVPCYDIVLSENFDGLHKKIEELGFGPLNKVCIITDTNVSAYWLNALNSELKGSFGECFNFIFPAGESSKHLGTVENAYECLLAHKFERSDLILALGGGVVGDLAGFVASSYMRGVAFIQIPTTLLAMVDSSIGGKTAVDFREQKNIIGAFYMPKLVFANISTLKTLPEREKVSGMAEVIKSALIKNMDLFIKLKNNPDQFFNNDNDYFKDIIIETCKIKKQVVENDPYEKGERMLLNFGHTIGHAMETRYHFEKLHGECVAVGSVAAAYLSYIQGRITLDVVNDIIGLFQAYHLPTSFPSAPFDQNEIQMLLKTDKKSTNGHPRFVLLHEIGDAYVDRSIPEEEIKQAILYIL